MRYLATVFLIVLYLIPFKDAFSERKTGTVPPVPETVYRSDGRPYFMEGFVNEERPGIRCHVSSISPVSGGKMGCVWYAGSREGAKDVAIYMSIYDSKTGLWSEPEALIDRKSASDELGRYIKKVGNPVLFRDGRGDLWLIYGSVAAGGWSLSTVNYKISRDGGRTWSDSEKLMLSPFFNLTNNVKNKGIITSGDSFILPVYREFINKQPGLIEISSSGKDVRYKIGFMSGKGVIQPTIINNGEGKLTAFFRNASKGGHDFIRRSESADAGLSWSAPSDTALPNPNSGFDSIRLSNGDYVMAVNNSFKDRSDMTLVISKDGGDNWKTLKILDDAPGREHSYSSLCRSDDGLYHLTYTYERRRIKHIVFNEAWIRSLEGEARAF